MNYQEAKALRQYQLSGGRVSAAELEEAVEILRSYKRPGTRPHLPWALSPGMVEALEAYVQTGSTVGAAELLRANQKTLSQQLTRAKERIGADNLVLAALAWAHHCYTKTQELQNANQR